MDSSAKAHNGFAGWPSSTGLAAYFELEVACQGVPDPQTGYLINIKAIDDAVRMHAIPEFFRTASARPLADTASILRSVCDRLRPALAGRLAGLRWRLTPYHWLAMQEDLANQVLLAQNFEFAAAHRLHIPQFSAAENRAAFGKCNNPSGHGHNYRLEVVVSPDSAQQGAFSLPTLERIVDEAVIQRFDHKHLNLDTAEFASINPSVEHIAMTIHSLLKQPLAAAGATLRYVTVWETEKTSCRFPATASLW